MYFRNNFTTKKKWTCPLREVQRKQVKIIILQGYILNIRIHSTPLGLTIARGIEKWTDQQQLNRS